MSPNPEPESRPAPAGALSALVTVRWGDSTVATKHLDGDAEAILGAALATLAPIPCESLGSAAIVVARVRKGEAVAFVPRGAVGFRERPRAIPAPVAGPSEITLAASETVSFSIGEFLVTVTAEERAKAPWAAVSPLGGAFTQVRYFAAAALAHALLMGLSAQAAHASVIEDAAPDHTELARYMASAEERSRAAENIVTEAGAESLGRDVNRHDGNGKHGGSERAAGAEGAMGESASRTKSPGRFSVTGPNERDPARSSASAPDRSNVPSGPDFTTREEAIADARSFGMVGVLAANRPRGPASGFAHAAATGPDPFQASGAMWAMAIGETQGAGGLGLTGVGEGGGGDGRGIGVWRMGMLGHTFGAEGSGTGGGGGALFGSGIGGWGGWGHPWGYGVTLGRISTIGHGPADVYNLNPRRERPDKPAEDEENRLPPDTIRRIVRQSHSMFRGCYQLALQTNPTLAGSITTRFLIGPDGRVKSAQNLGHDLPDAKVITCVTGVFRSLTFPEPPGGAPVTVTYPLTFSSEE